MGQVKEALMDACEAVITLARKAGVQTWCGYDAEALMGNLMENNLVPAPRGILVLTAYHPVLGPCFVDDIREHFLRYFGVEL